MEFSPNPVPTRTTRVSSDETLTVLEAARQAGVTQSAIIRWIRNGYLSATPSSQGWQIPAAMLEDAASAADHARGTAPVPGPAGPTLAPSPTSIRRSLERRVQTSAPADVSEQIVTPLAELIRDQIDVVHDQAEVIGWLQAERARLAAEVQLLKANPVSHDVIPEPTLTTDDSQDESELYDEVVSLLWKDADAPSRDTGSSNPWQVDDVQDSDVDDNFLADVPDELTDSNEPDWENRLRVEEYADPSWFFGNGPAGPAHEKGEKSQAAILKPIVPRQPDKPQSEEDQTLHRMIDETERKIADLWRNQEELRSAPRVVIEHREIEQSDRGNMWQRLWPLRR